MSWLCDKTKKICITISSHFYHNLTKKILWSSLALKDSYSTILSNKWSQRDKNVMRIWWLEISTYFLVHIIWKFPPLQNLMSDARCLDVDACLSAPNAYDRSNVGQALGLDYTKLWEIGCQIEGRSSLSHFHSLPWCTYSFLWGQIHHGWYPTASSQMAISIKS